MEIILATTSKIFTNTKKMELQSATLSYYYKHHNTGEEFLACNFPNSTITLK